MKNNNSYSNNRTGNGKTSFYAPNSKKRNHDSEDWLLDERTGKLTNGQPRRSTSAAKPASRPTAKATSAKATSAKPAPRKEGFTSKQAENNAAAKVRRDSFDNRPARQSYSQAEAAPAPVQEVVEQRENLLVGRNPIREALKSGRDIEKLMVAAGDWTGSMREIIATAKERRIVVQEVDRRHLDEIAPHHQGIIAFVPMIPYSTVQEILDEAEKRGEPPFIVVLDGVTDPHNLGAILRSAECCGAHGVIVPERRASGLTPTVVRSAAGATEWIRVARVVNIARTLDDLKAKGIWVYAAAMDGKRYDKVDMKGPAALVVGDEGEGISRLVMEKSDFKVAIPLKGHVDSMNASVAAGILLCEMMRQRLDS